MAKRFHAQDMVTDTSLQTAVGLVFLEWGLAQMHLCVAIWDLLKVSDEKARAVTADLESKARINLFKSLIKMRYPEEHHPARVSAINIVGRLKGLSSVRNTMAHHPFKDDQSNSRTIVAIKVAAGGAAPQVKNATYTFEELTDHLAEIGQVIEDLAQWREDNP